jgi:hypothetical protein
MNKGFCVSLILTLLVPAVVLGWNFDFEMFGTVMETPAVYDGTLTSGGDGTIGITLDDTGWPTDPAARWDHIWETYFQDNYQGSAGAMKWVGQIPGRFYIDAVNAPAGYNGSCEGSINAKITVRDVDEDMVLDPWEKTKQHLFDGRLSKQCDDPGTGDMYCMWGWGALASNHFSFWDPPVQDTLSNGGNLTLMSGCPTATENATWGGVKALYK